MEDNPEIFKNMVASPDDNLNEQIQHKFIRNIVKPYAMNPFMNGDMDTIPEKAISKTKPNLSPPKEIPSGRTNISELSMEPDVSNEIPFSENHGQFTLQLQEHAQKLDDILALVEKPGDSQNSSTTDRIIIFVMLGINIILLYLLWKEKSRSV
jgi:hypothetical protein